MSRGVSVFDLDGTLSKSDTLLSYLRGYLRRNPVRLPRTVHLPAAGALHLVGLRDNAWLKVRFLRAILGGLTIEELTPWTQSFLGDLLARGLRDEGLRELERRRDAGDVVVLATASVDLFVAQLAEQLAFDAVFCTSLARDGAGRLSGELADGNCFGESKLMRVEQFLTQQGLTGPLTAYSDHHADLPLLRRADRAFAVCPTVPLRLAARNGSMSILDWRRPGSR